MEKWNIRLLMERFLITDEPQNVEYQISNVEGWNRFALVFFTKKFIIV